MTRILDRIARSHRGEFRPTTVDEYFALRLAYRLGEPEAAAYYAVLASQYPQHNLVCAFSKTLASEDAAQRPGRMFTEYLRSMGKNGDKTIPQIRLLAVRVERRSVAVAVFVGTHLEGRRVLQLSADPSGAAASAAALIKNLLIEEDCTSAAIEPAPQRADILRAAVHRAVTAQIQSWGLSLWQISIETLLAAFAHPPLRNRPDLRDLMLDIFQQPPLKAAHICALDALAIGLFVQTERLFNNF